MQKTAVTKHWRVIFLLFFSLSLIPIVYAHCPLCTGAVVAGAAVSKYYGLDMSIVGLFIGAFAISTGLWVGLKLKRYFRFQLPIIILASFLLTIIPVLGSITNDSLYFPLLLFGQEGSIFNKVYWIDKFLLGGVIGSLVCLLGYWIHSYVKKTRGKVLFPFQGIAITLFLLLILSLLFYFIFS